MASSRLRTLSVVHTRGVRRVVICVEAECVAEGQRRESVPVEIQIQALCVDVRVAGVRGDGGLPWKRAIRGRVTSREENVTYQGLCPIILPSLIDVFSGSRPRGCSLRKVRQSDPLLRKALRFLETWEESRIPEPRVVPRRGEAFLTSSIDSRVVHLHGRDEALWGGMSVAMSSAVL